MSKFFVEIGTSDFDTFEHLAEEGWKGIFVEPVKKLLDNLERFDNCHYENSAILTYDGMTELKYFDVDWAEGWYRGVGNTDMSRNHFHNPDLKDKEVVEDVECMRLDTLIKKYNVEKIDYLKVDIEGREFMIMMDYSWKIKPKQVKIEHTHWHQNNTNPIDWSWQHPTHQESLKTMVEKLESLGYNIVIGKDDIIGVLE